MSSIFPFTEQLQYGLAGAPLGGSVSVSIIALAVCLAGCATGATKSHADASTKPPTARDASLISCSYTLGTHASCIEISSNSPQIKAAPRRCMHNKTIFGDAEGTFREAPCSKAGVEASCSLQQPNAAKLYSYRGETDSDESRRGLVEGVRATCLAKGGTFQLEDPSTVVSCTHRLPNRAMFCREETVFPASSDVIQRVTADCAKHGGTFQISDCPRQNTLGECAFEAPHYPTIFQKLVAYRGVSANETEEILHALTSSCKKHDGDLSMAP